MRSIHDSGYKKLFSNVTIFRELIETFVHETWVKDLDFTDCETIDKSFIADHYKETESDLIYKVKFRGHDAYLFVLLEFQSSVDRFMALRVLSYVTGFYMDYAQAEQNVRTLPPVFPIVLYNGDRRWTAPVTFSALLEDAAILGKYAPRFQYLKVAEQEYSKEELLAIRNIVSTLFLAETHYDRDLLVQECVNIFQHEDDRQAVSLLLNWFRQLMEHGRFRAGDYDDLEQVYQESEEAKRKYADYGFGKRTPEISSRRPNRRPNRRPSRGANRGRKRGVAQRFTARDFAVYGSQIRQARVALA